MSENDQLVPLKPVLREPNSQSLRQQSVRDLEATEVDSFAYLRANWDVLVKHRVLILTVTVLLTVLVAIYSFKVRPVYEATARIDVEAEMPFLQTLNDLFKSDSGDDTFLATQVSVLQSDKLAWDTIQQLNLGGQQEFGGGTARPGAVGTQLASQAALISWFNAARHINRVKDTRMLEVSFEHTNPDLAARAANALVNNYIEYNFRTKYDATRQATGWLEQQLDELKLRVEKSQQAMVDYERQNNIVDIGDKSSVAQARLEDLSKNLTTAQSERLQKQSVYEMVKSNDAQVGFLEPNGLLARLEEKEADLREQYAEIVTQYGPSHPKMIRLREQQKDIGVLIQRERRRVVENIRNDYLASVEREKLLAGAETEQKAEVGRVSQLLIQHNLLKREFDTNQQLYETLLQHLKDANVSAGLRATNIHLVDQAVAPTTPVRPKRARNIAFAVAVGLALGMGMAFAREALANSIKGAQEVENLILAPALAIVPDVFSAGQNRSRLFAGRAEKKAQKAEIVELSVLRSPGSSIAEAFRTLRTSILLSTADRPPQLLLITSSQPHEGKTSTSMNLAFTLAQMGSRVLIVDADMRKRRVAMALKLSNEKGLSGVLTGSYGMEDALLQVEEVKTLYVLPSGPNPPNPAELLCSIKMQDLLKQMREQFDHVVLDSPPVLPITDATILSSKVDGVVLVVENEVTTRAALSRSCGVIRHSGGKILGAVLNKVDARRDGYYGHYYYYGYYSKGYYDYAPGNGKG